MNTISWSQHKNILKVTKILIINKWRKDFKIDSLNSLSLSKLNKKKKLWIYFLKKSAKLLIILIKNGESSKLKQLDQFLQK
jgi:hypothetical protein